MTNTIDIAIIQYWFAKNDLHLHSRTLFPDKWELNFLYTDPS